jgi:predicted DNA-binding protein with PD1-like motif
MKTHVFRLRKGQDLKDALKNFAKENHILAGVILTAVGCLTKTTIRMAGATPQKQDVRTYDGDVEVVSLVGRLSVSDSHLHISVANKDGMTMGGHLKEGCTVGTTMEIIIGELEEYMFETEQDSATGFGELKVVPRSAKAAV